MMSLMRRYGRQYSRRVIASDVNSAQGIVNKLAHLHEQYADALEVVTIKITDDMFPTAQVFADANGRMNPNNDDREMAAQRFETGQWVDFTNSILEVFNKELLIHRITTRIIGNRPISGGGSEGILEYELEMRDWEVNI